ncbi:MAG: class I SAM-dependent methyltransferase [Actinomycetia bacterium]|nr:class I SAM-dependent methyltransferase [Actinomycetes bacterium]
MSSPPVAEAGAQRAIPQKRFGPARRMAARIAGSGPLANTRRTWDENQVDRNLPLTRSQKAQLAGYLVLRDYAAGQFPPPEPVDQQETFAAEEDYRELTPGMTAADVASVEMRKPFWGQETTGYLESFGKIVQALGQAELAPPAQLLELGGGSGWTAEFLALMGYRVVSTTIAPDDVASGQRRVASIAAKGLDAELEFAVSAMEDVATQVAVQDEFDGVFVFEALHHAFDWRAALRSAHRTLRTGGRILICNEPNVSHTVVSYRVAQLTGVIERGFSASELRAGLRDAGFTDIRFLRRAPGFGVRPHWIIARKT